MTMIDGGGGSVTDPTTVAEQRSSSSSLRTRPSDDDPAEPAIVLPGYELWDPTASGVEHSRQKLQHSSHQLTTKLGELTKSYRNSNSHKNKNSRNNSAIVRIVPCATEAATWNYRCRCNFQIILQQKTMGSHGNTTTTEFRYALRTHGQPITLGTHNTFPIATPQIQRAMRDVLDYFNKTNQHHDSDTTTHHRMLTQYITSCTFSSGWYDPDQKDTTTTTVALCNCVLTLNYYCPATQPNDSASSSLSVLQHAPHQRQWRTAATFLLQQLPGVQQINGRSKGIVLAVTKKKKTDDDEDAEQGKTAIIRDTLHLIRYEPVPVPSTTMLPPSTSGTQVRESPTTLEFDVCLVPTAEEEYETKPKEHSQPPPPRPEINTSTGKRSVIIPVLYEKPETAFYHPNATVMLTALRWILNRLVWIRSHKSNNCNKSKNQNTHPNTLLKVLELYCGCGAHTIAMGKSGLVSHIEAIELEPHLVQACARNITVNALTSIITVERNDAGRWSHEATAAAAAAARARRRRHGVGSSDTMANTTQENQPKYGYDVVLVDPPRQGLDDHVCRMVMLSTHDDDTSNSNSNSNPHDNTDELDTADDGEKKQSRRSMFEHILYVSCGHQALLRDLERLSPVYEVIDCIQLDLFPRTNSIETLVHLTRRKTQQ